MHAVTAFLFAHDCDIVDIMFPVNSVPAGGVEIPQGWGMQVVGEDAHLDVLTPLLGRQQAVGAYVSLHEITESEPDHTNSRGPSSGEARSVRTG